MLLGALIKATDKQGISEPQLLGSHPHRSINQVKVALLKFETPVWYSLRDYRYHQRRSSFGNVPKARIDRHSCSVKLLLEPGVDKIWGSLKGLKLDDYRIQQEDEVTTI
jgi:hypothetical protein